MIAPAPLVLHRFETRLGAMSAAATPEGLCLLEFSEGRGRLESELAEVERLLGCKAAEGENPHTRQALRELEEYYSGKRRAFEVPLQLAGTAFQQAVWRALVTIPFGETVSYQDQARRVGKPEAVRAVAAANGRNHLAVIVPCHRVIGKDGSLTGYGGGLHRKAWLLAHEKAVRGEEALPLFRPREGPR
jgi:AraC family transcriptional regulator, regulatory protein of adaptative response / methylated-DNA-[protein]-cysteine methyltransferase